MKKLLLLLLCVPLMFSCGENKDNENTEKNNIGCIDGDCENGTGTFIYENGDKYEGEWKDDKRSGVGIYTFGEGEFEGDKYVGEWNNDMTNGHGTYIFGRGEFKGDKYVGEHKDDNFQGQGIYIYADGTVEKGLWENNEFIGEE